MKHRVCRTTTIPSLLVASVITIELIIAMGKGLSRQQTDGQCGPLIEASLRTFRADDCRHRSCSRTTHSSGLGSRLEFSPRRNCDRLRNHWIKLGELPSQSALASRRFGRPWGSRWEKFYGGNARDSQVCCRCELRSAGEGRLNGRYRLHSRSRPRLSRAYQPEY